MSGGTKELVKKRAARSANETRQLKEAGKETAIPVDTDGPVKHMSGRVPGLDGVRALAVLAVIAFHVGMRMTPGGFLGVDIFFALSGYLITDLLVAQHARCGRLDLRGFWVRRARRLLPALAMLLVAVTATVALFEPDQLPALGPTLAAAVSYSSNWYQALHHVSYFAAFGPPPPLQHLWSLAIEEQFYLAWPLLLLLVLTRLRGRWARVLTAWLGALASAAAVALIYLPGGDPSRVYYGTDTHATGLLVGAALALTWPMATLTNASRKFARRLDYLGGAGLVVLAWAVVHFSGADLAVYPLGLAVAALAAAGLTAAAAAPGTVSALLSLPPLRWLGSWKSPSCGTASGPPGARPRDPCPCCVGQPPWPSPALPGTASSTHRPGRPAWKSRSPGVSGSARPPEPMSRGRYLGLRPSHHLHSPSARSWAGRSPRSAIRSCWRGPWHSIPCCRASTSTPGPAGRCRPAFMWYAASRTAVGCVRSW